MQAMTRLIMDCPIYKVPRRLRIVWQAQKYVGEVSISNWSWIHYGYRVSSHIKIQNIEVNTRVRGQIDISIWTIFIRLVWGTRYWSLNKHFRHSKNSIQNSVTSIVWNVRTNNWKNVTGKLQQTASQPNFVHLQQCNSNCYTNCSR
jgi:hypothetical protein